MEICPLGKTFAHLVILKVLKKADSSGKLLSFVENLQNPREIFPLNFAIYGILHNLKLQGLKLCEFNIRNI